MGLVTEPVVAWATLHGHPQNDATLWDPLVHVCCVRVALWTFLLTAMRRYALNAVNAGSTSVGIKASNGVVIATEKKLPTLMDENSFEKVSMLTKDIGVVYSGACATPRGDHMQRWLG